MMETWETARKGQIVEGRVTKLLAALQEAGYFNIPFDNDYLAALKSVLVDYLHLVREKRPTKPLGLSDLGEAIDQAYPVYEQEVAPLIPNDGGSQQSP